MQEQSPYENPIKCITSAEERTAEMIDKLVTSTELFFSSIKPVTSEISHLSCPLPTKRIKGVFQKLQGPSEFANITPSFTSSFEKYTNLLVQLQGFDELSEQILKSFLESLKSFRDGYNSKISQILSDVQVSQQALNEAELNNRSADQDYRSLCGEIESLKQKMSDQDSKSHGLYNDLVLSFKRKQDAAFEALDKLNDARRSYSLVAEKALYKFEEVDNWRDTQMRQIFTNLAHSFTAYSIMKDESSAQLLSIIKQICGRDDIETTIPDSIDENDQLTPAKITVTNVQSAIRDYVIPEDVFSEEMRHFYGLAKDDFMIEDKKIAKGSKVEVLQKKEAQLTVRDPLGETTKDVDSDLIEQKPEFVRKLLRATEDTADGEMKVIKGDVVLVLEMKDGVAECESLVGMRGRLPASTLEPYAPN